MKPTSKTRILSALLAALMLSGSLASCATGGTASDITENPFIPPETETVSIISDDLPEDLYYDDDEVSIICRTEASWTVSEIAVDGLKSEPVNDAIFERNKAVEERLGVKIISMQESGGSGTALDKVVVAVKGGSKDYDILADCSHQIISASLSGCFADLRTTEYIDFDQVWWTQGFHDAVEYKGSQYALLGSMLLSMYRFGFITVFNKNLFEDAAQPLLYEYVENGTWTLDKQAQLVPLFHTDDGNGKQDWNGLDTFGLVTSSYTSLDAYWSALQLDILKRDDEGNYQLVLDTEKLHDAVDKIQHLYYNTEGGTLDALPDAGDDAIFALIRTLFTENHAAMATIRLMEMENSVMRNMEQEYGIVPMPKYDEQQDGYYTMLHDQFTAVSIPVTVTGDRLAEMSAVLEAMSSASYHIVKPAYYETTLRTKLAQDPQSADMIDIISENVYIDAGILLIHELGAYHHGLRDIVKSRTNSTASLYKAKNAACKKSLERVCKSLDKLDK